MDYFPTEGWLEAYGRALDENEALEDLAAGWGRGFDGDVLPVVADIPLDERGSATSRRRYAGSYPRPSATASTGSHSPTPRTYSARRYDRRFPESPGIARDLLEQIEENIVDGDIYAYVGLDGGDAPSSRYSATPTSGRRGSSSAGRMTSGRRSSTAAGFGAVERRSRRGGQPALPAPVLGDVPATRGTCRRRRYDPPLRGPPELLGRPDARPGRPTARGPPADGGAAVLADAAALLTAR